MKIWTQYNEKLNKKISLFSYIIKFYSNALNDIPKVNSTYFPYKNEFEYIINKQHNISIAINSPNGLVAPNIKNVFSKNILEID